MTEKTIGILGGMGPEATLDLFAKIIANTPAAKDQDHLRVVIDSNPRVPDRTAAILHSGPSPVPAMKAGIEALKKAGADFVVIPCVSAHFFLQELQGESGLPLLSMFEVTAEHILQQHPTIHKLGMLATTGTLQGGRFRAASSPPARSASSTGRSNRRPPSAMRWRPSASRAVCVLAVGIDAALLPRPA